MSEFEPLVHPRSVQEMQKSSEETRHRGTFTPHCQLAFRKFRKRFRDSAQKYKCTATRVACAVGYAGHLTRKYESGLRENFDEMQRYSRRWNLKLQDRSKVGFIFAHSHLRSPNKILENYCLQIPNSEITLADNYYQTTTAFMVKEIMLVLFEVLLTWDFRPNIQYRVKNNKGTVSQVLRLLKNEQKEFSQLL